MYREALQAAKRSAARHFAPHVGKAVRIHPTPPCIGPAPHRADVSRWCAPQLQALIYGLTHRNPSQRLSLLKALESPWFHTASKTPVHAASAENLSAYVRARARFLKAARRVRMAGAYAHQRQWMLGAVGLPRHTTTMLRHKFMDMVARTTRERGRVVASRPPLSVDARHFALLMEEVGLGGISEMLGFFELLDVNGDGYVTYAPWHCGGGGDVVALT